MTQKKKTVKNFAAPEGPQGSFKKKTDMVVDAIPKVALAARKDKIPNISTTFLNAKNRRGKVGETKGVSLPHFDFVVRVCFD